MEGNQAKSRRLAPIEHSTLTYHPSDVQSISQQKDASQFPSGTSPRPTDPDLADQDSDGEDSLDHAEGCRARPETGETLSNTDPWRLNPERMPRSITLELPEALLAEVLDLAARQGRCLNEIATDLIAAQLHTDSTG